MQANVLRPIKMIICQVQMTRYIPNRCHREQNKTRKARELTGRPTATLNREILLIPAVSLMFWLNVTLGFDNPPYAVPATRFNWNFNTRWRRKMKSIRNNRLIWTIIIPFHPPASWSLINTCKAWPAEKIVRRGFCPLLRNPSSASILTLNKPEHYKPEMFKNGKL